MAKKYTADTFEGAVTGTASGNVAKTGDTMTGNLTVDTTGGKVTLGGSSAVIVHDSGSTSTQKLEVGQYYGFQTYSNANITVATRTSSGYGGQGVINLIGGQYGSPQIQFKTDNASTPGAGLENAYVGFYGGGAGDLRLNYSTSSASNNVYLRNDSTYFEKPIRIGANSTSNELDDYEEGTFDFQFRISSTNYDFNTTNFQGPSTNFHNYSRYVKVGRKVTLYFDIRWSTVPWSSFADTNEIKILGLPFTLSTGSSSVPAGIGGTYNFGSNPTLSSSADAAESGAISGRFFHSVGGQVLLTRNYYNVGYYTAWYSGSILKGDWPANDPGAAQSLKGMFTYYTTD